MTFERGPRDVGQLMFGFTPNRGMGVVASSLASAAAEAAWWERLRKHVRMASAGIGAHQPTEAFSYFEFDEESAALLRRVPGRGDGRNFSHALVASPDSLRPWSTSLFNFDWYDEPPQYRLSAIEHEDLMGRLTPLGDAAASSRRRVTLSGLVGTLLREPHGKISVRGVDDAEVIPMLILTREILEPVFGGARPAYPWTYSTYEATDNIDGQDLRRILFLREFPEFGETDRTRLDITNAAQGKDVHSLLALHLIDFHSADSASYGETVSGRMMRDTSLPERIDSLINDMRRTGEIFVPRPTPCSGTRRGGPAVSRDNWLDTSLRSPADMESAGQTEAHRLVDDQPPRVPSHITTTAGPQPGSPHAQQRGLTAGDFYRRLAILQARLRLVITLMLVQATAILCLTVYVMLSR